MVRIESEEVKPTKEQKITIFGSTLYGGAVAKETADKFVGMVSLRAFESDEEDENARVPLNLVAVVDKSGSMSGPKLASLKQTLSFVLKELGKHDKFGIVEYDTQVTTSLALTTMDEKGKQNAQRVVDSIRAGSSTNLSGGFLEGLRMFTGGADTKVVSSLLLMTDGLANVGITSPQGIVSMFQKAQSEGTGRCTVNTFGFGADHDAKLLKDICGAGEGMYYYIENEDSIPTAFADCLGGLLSVVGQGMELKIEAAQNHLIQHVWTAKSLTVLEPNRSYRIALGDLQEGEERDVPFEISLPAVSTSDSVPIAHVTLSYFDVKAETMKEIKCEVTLDRPETLTEQHKTPNLLVDRNCNRCKAGKAMEQASEFASKGEFKAARDLLERVISEISASHSSQEDFCKELIKELRNALSGVQDRTSYANQGQYQMNCFSHAMNMQRSAGPSVSREASPAFASYETSARSRMKSKFSKI